MTQRTVTALLLLAAVAVLVAAGIAWAQSSSNYDNSWHVLSAGGREGMASENYNSHGTTSQLTIGPAGSQNYRVGSGYWYGLPAEPPCIEVTDVELTLLTGGTLYTDTLVQFEADISPDGASSYSYTIDYGDSISDTGSSDQDPLAFEHTYASTGTFTAQVEAWNCQMTAPVTDAVQVIVSEYGVCIQVEDVELALLTSGALYTDTLVEFEADVSPPNASTPYSYTLDYGDGVTVGLSLSDSNPLAFEHTYTQPGTFTIQAEVWNCQMTTPATDALQVEVSPSQVEPDIVVSPPSIDVLLNPDDVSTRSLTIGNEGTGTLTWDLTESPEVAWLHATPVSGTLAPAGSTSISLTLNSTGLSDGTYTSTLVIGNNDPDENPVNVGVTLVVTSAACIEVTEVSFEHVPITVTAGQAVTFTATYTPDDAWEPVDVAWSFGGTGLQVTHVFTPAGPYTVAVTATNPCGSASFFEQIEVSAPQPSQYDIYLPIIVREI